MIQLLNCDCMEYMATLPDKAFDLAIVDPPYGINESAYRSGRANTTTKLAATKKYIDSVWNQERPDGEYFDELLRVSRNQIIFGGNYFSSLLPSQRCWIVWDKKTTGGFDDCELAWTSFNSSVRKFEFMWNGMLQDNMKDKEFRIHPTQKPVALYQWLLKNYAKQGDKILDTHGGSMSIAIACHDLGFDLTLYEIDKDYFQAGKERLVRHMTQTNLFMNETELVVNT